MWFSGLNLIYSVSLLTISNGLRDYLRIFDIKRNSILFETQSTLFYAFFTTKKWKYICVLLKEEKICTSFEIFCIILQFSHFSGYALKYTAGWTYRFNCTKQTWSEVEKVSIEKSQHPTTQCGRHIHLATRKQHKHAVILTNSVPLMSLCESISARLPTSWANAQLSN